MDEITKGLIANEEDFKDPIHFLEQDEWADVNINEDWLDPTKGYEKPKYTLSYRGSKFAPLGGIHALTGQPGNGKTMTFAQFIVATLKGDWDELHYELKEERPEPSVLYIDTEMEVGNTQLVMLRVYEMMEWPKGTVQDRFRILRLRETDRSEDRWRKILRAIYELRDKITVAYIDGLLDVVADFNKNDECQEIIYKCMKTASYYGISLWCLVHENPGSTKMVGHLGSMLERKVTDSFGTIKEKAPDGEVTFTIKQKKARGKDVEDIKFHIEDGPNGYGIPKQAAVVIGSSKDEPKPYDVFVRDVITSQEGITTRELRQAVLKEYHVGAKKADSILWELEEQNFVSRDENKRYHIIDYSTKQKEVPF